MASNSITNDRLLRALRCEPVDCTPVWVMRQAGRYLPEYRAIRTQVDGFLSLCQTPSLACEVTLQPLKRFDLDAAILFSDILVIPHAMGMSLEFKTGEGPVFLEPLRDVESIADLEPVNLAMALDYVYETIDRIKSELKGAVPLIGFSGSPWTLACYMVEGKGSKTFSKVRAMLYRHPELMARLLETLSTQIVDYLALQVHSGVDVLMLFDTWGSLLSTDAYEQFSLHYMSKIIRALRARPDCSNVPIILFTKGGGQWLEAMAQSGCDAVGVDWTLTLAMARSRVGDRIALQGNLDPAVLYGSPDCIREAVKRVLTNRGTSVGHIFNLGHGIYPDVPPEHLDVMVNAVHELSQIP